MVVIAIKKMVLQKTKRKKIFALLVIFLLGEFLFLLPSALGAGQAFEYQNPLTVNSFSQWLSNLLASVQGIIGWLAIIMIIVGGVIYLTSAGSEKQISWAKGIIKYALIGFAVAVAAPSLLKEIKEVALSGPFASDLIDSAKPIPLILADILDFAITLVGILAIISFTVGGIMYFTALGDKQKADTGKKIAFYSAIAVLVSGLGVIIIKQIIVILEAGS